MKKLLALGLCISMIFPTISFAQTVVHNTSPDSVIKGKVISVNGEPLKGVLINEKHTTISHLTKENGEFQFMPSNRYASIVFSAKDYKKKEFDLDEDMSKVVLWPKMNDHRKTNIAFSFVNETIDTEFQPENIPEFSSNMGYGFTLGRTFYFKHRNPKPIIRFGIMADFIDATYSIYECEDIYFSKVSKSTVTNITGGLSAGPAITILPGRLFNLQLYGKFAPRYSLLTFDEEEAKMAFTAFSTGYCAGANISIGHVGIGAELTSHSYSYSTSDEIYPTEQKPLYDRMGVSDGSANITGMRAYLILKF